MTHVGSLPAAVAAAKQAGISLDRIVVLGATSAPRPHSTVEELVAAGLLERRPYRDPGSRTRHEYVLTPMGRDLVPAALALMQWGDRWLQGDRGAPLALSHADCGEPLSVEVRCAAGHQVELGEIAVEVAPRR